jgi:GNAT superfamily N-acetyltransferase
MSDPRNLLIVSHMKRLWLPYLRSQPEAITRDYQQVLKRFPKADAYHFRGLFDQNGILQAAAAIEIERSPVFLELLITAPWYLKGSGSKLLLGIIQESVKVGAKGAIELQAAPGAVTFYQKYGFTIVKPPQKPGWDTPMRLSSNTARQLLRCAVIEADGVKVPPGFGGSL